MTEHVKQPVPDWLADIHAEIDNGPMTEPKAIHLYQEAIRRGLGKLLEAALVERVQADVSDRPEDTGE